MAKTKLDQITKTLGWDEAAFELPVKGNKHPMIVTGNAELLTEMYTNIFGHPPMPDNNQETITAAPQTSLKPKVGLTHLANLLVAEINRKRAERAKAKAVERELVFWMAYDAENGTHFAEEARRQVNRFNDQQFARKANSRLKDNPVLGFIHFDPTRNYRDANGEWGVLVKKT
jgi:hypothetical protein